MAAQGRVFDLAEANRLIPRLEALLSELEEKQRLFERRHDELFFEELLEEASPPESQLQELEEILAALEQHIGSIRNLGCVLRHPQRGLVDFLARRDNEWIYYCWRRGEKEVQFYHSLQGGFFERHPLR